MAQEHFLLGIFFPGWRQGIDPLISRVRVIYVNHSRHNDTPCIGYITVDIAQGGFFSLFVFGGGWGRARSYSGHDDNSGSCEDLGLTRLMRL